MSVHEAAGGCDIRMISDGPHLIAYADYVSRQIFFPSSIQFELTQNIITEHCQPNAPGLCHPTSFCLLVIFGCIINIICFIWSRESCNMLCLLSRLRLGDPFEIPTSLEAQTFDENRWSFCLNSIKLQHFRRICVRIVLLHLLYDSPFILWLPQFFLEYVKL